MLTRCCAVLTPMDAHRTELIGSIERTVLAVIDWTDGGILPVYPSASLPPSLPPLLLPCPSRSRVRHYSNPSRPSATTHPGGPAGRTDNEYRFSILSELPFAHWVAEVGKAALANGGFRGGQRVRSIRGAGLGREVGRERGRRRDSTACILGGKGNGE